MGAELLVLVVLSGALAAFLALYAVFDYFLQRRRVVHQLRALDSYELAPADVRARELAAPARNRLVFPGAKRVARAAARLTPQGVTERLRQELVQAGSPRGWDAERVLIAKLLLGVGLGGLGFFAGVTLATDPILTLPMVAVGAFVGWFAPEWIVRSKARARQDEIGRTLPDALDLLSITVEAGLGFDSALQRVAQEMGGALGQELYRVVQEMQLGMSRQEALRGLADRSDVDALKEFVVAMIQADAFGISIAHVLRVQADELRLKRRQRVEETAMKIPVKMIFPLIMCILPATFIVLVGPAVLRIIDTLAGL